MVIVYHGTIRKKSPQKQIQVNLIFMFDPFPKKNVGSMFWVVPPVAVTTRRSLSTFIGHWYWEDNPRYVVHHPFHVHSPTCRCTASQLDVPSELVDTGDTVPGKQAASTCISQALAKKPLMARNPANHHLGGEPGMVLKPRLTNGMDKLPSSTGEFPGFLVAINSRKQPCQGEVGFNPEFIGSFQPGFGVKVQNISTHHLAPTKSANMSFCSWVQMT